MLLSFQLIAAAIFYLSAVSTCNANRSSPPAVTVSVGGLSVSVNTENSLIRAKQKCDVTEGSTEPCVQPCPDGLTCVAGNITGYCPLGQWCEKGVVSPCPRGSYGETYGLTTSSCTGRCDTMWTGGEGAIVCDQFSISGIFIVIAVLCAAIAAILLAILLTKKASRSGCSLYPLQNTTVSEEMEAAMLVEARTSKQHQIRDHVAVLVSNIMKHAFPSVFFLSSALVQRGLDSPEQVSASIDAMRQELTDHINVAFLSHPCIRFDDDTYPLSLPDWFSLTLASPIGEQRVFELAKSFAMGIKPAVEQDIMEWFQRRRQQQQQQLQQQHRLPDTSHEESKQELFRESALKASDSIWPSVDRDLKIVMRVSLIPQYNNPLLSDLRVDYGSGTAPEKYCDNYFWVPFSAISDLMMIVASFACIVGGPLVTLNVIGTNLADAASYPGVNISYAELDIPWYAPQVQVDLDLFPVMRECTNLYGPIYFTLHLIAFACFCICSFSSFVQVCGIFSRSALLCRSCTRNMRTSWKRRTQASRSYAWLMDQQVTDVCRCIGFIVAVGALAVYYPGCVMRLGRTAPAAVEAFEVVNDRFHPYEQIPPNTSLNFNLNVIVQVSFVLSVVGVVSTLIPTSIAFVQARQRRERSNAQEDGVSPDDLNAALVFPSASVDSSNGSSGHVYHDFDALEQRESGAGVARHSVQPPDSSTDMKVPQSYQGSE